MVKSTQKIVVSVIIPVYNEERNIGSLIESLIKSDYPKHKYEIIIIDNNSTDRTYSIAQKYNVKLIKQNKTQSSYASRNLGIKEAKGDILAFTDADCIVDKNWLKKSVDILQKNPIIDIIAGQVKFVTRSENFYSYYDKCVHLNQENYVRNGRCATANMITRKEAFIKNGLFRGDYVSGGDTEWSSRATKKCMILMYLKDIIVYHKARNSLKSLIKKRIRIGYGYGYKNRGKGFVLMVSEVIRMIVFRGSKIWFNLFKKRKLTLTHFISYLLFDRFMSMYYVKGFIKGYSSAN
ncbi:glycosyltransferase [Candidatus Woesearchaeota archaeon]|nr:glycosyltransferase [Candidatus Woesearchaeota archaeon]